MSKTWRWWWWWKVGWMYVACATTEHHPYARYAIGEVERLLPSFLLAKLAATLSLGKTKEA